MKKDNSISYEITHKEIDSIQSTIARMSENSFRIKGWTVTLAVGIEFIQVIAKIPAFNIISSMILQTIVVLLLWCLDSVFLRTERIYRLWYDFYIVNKRNSTGEWQYMLNTNHIKAILKKELAQKNISIPSIFRVFFSKTLCLFYISILLYRVIISVCALIM